ncbi:MAG: proteasome assembly chaperone family protein [Thaumarchaeota archaeon]|nr:proteasome assembly chaperone family protein [Nitrososphaerota archaeon]
MASEITIREIKSINIEGGYLIDGFPYAGLANAIATESLTSTMDFELAGVIDSELFPPISIIKDGTPNFPVRIFVNNTLKVAVFSSYLTPHESLHREVARTMSSWANQHKCSLILSSSVIKAGSEGPAIMGIASTAEAKKKLSDASIPILQNGTIPGIPGILLNEGVLSKTNVIVLLVKGQDPGPDFRSGAEICMALSKLVPGTSCDLSTLLHEAEIIEHGLKQTEEETAPLKESMYG